MIHPLNLLQIEVPLKAALSSENIRVNVPSEFTVAIGTDADARNNATIRLLGLATTEIIKQAEDIIFVDDHEPNVVAARSYGIHTHHFLGAAGLRAELEAAGLQDRLAGVFDADTPASLRRRLRDHGSVILSNPDMLHASILPYHPKWQRFFSQVYTDAGILGPTTAVSSTYIILFIIFAAFLQASRVGDYFVNFAFAAAGSRSKSR